MHELLARRCPGKGGPGTGEKGENGWMKALDQGLQPYPVHCMVCFAQSGVMNAATWERDGYYLCDVHKDTPLHTMPQRFTT